MKSSIMTLLIGFLILISCLLWLAIRKSDPLTFHLPEAKSQDKFWAICFFALYTLSVISNYLRSDIYERPLLYFILTALMAGAIVCEILAAERRHAGFILLQVLLLGVSISWTQQLISPGLVGIDTWYHVDLANRIIADSFLPMNYSYSTMPFFHILISMTSVITTLPSKLAMMVSVSFGQIACNAFFIFLIANYLFKNYRIGLLATLLVIIANLHILMSWMSIPNGFGAAFIPIILYLLFTGIKDTSRFVVSFLLILLMFSIILTHSIVAMCMAIIFFVAWGAFAFYRFCYSQNEDYISWLVPVGFTIGMLTWWSFMAGYLGSLSRFIKLDYSLSFAQGTVIDTIAVATPPGEYVFSLLGQYLFITLSLVGILYMVSRKGNISTFSLALLSVTPLCITFIANFTHSDIIPFRWLYIAQILLSIPLALALYSVGVWKMKKPIYIHFFFFGFIVVFSFLMLMGPGGNNDNYTFTPTSQESIFYTQSEMTGSDFVAKKSIGGISSDDFEANIILDGYHINEERWVPLKTALNSGIFNHDGSVKIFRSRFIVQSQRMGQFSPKIGPDLNFYMSKSGFDKIYDNTAMTSYIG